MREIKFRAWDKTFNKMIENPSLDIRSDTWEYMQFTGLKDKNGKEIYEGDALNVFNWGHNSKELLGVTAVVWDSNEHGWRYKNSSELMSEDVYDQFRNVEVIGNIYENPELLKEQP